MLPAAGLPRAHPRGDSRALAFIVSLDPRVACEPQNPPNTALARYFGVLWDLSAVYSSVGVGVAREEPAE